MRANIKFHTPDELYAAQLQRSIELKTVQPRHPDDGAIEGAVYLILTGIVWTFVGLIWWFR